MNAKLLSARRAISSQFIALGVFLTLLLGGILVPVYTDEIGWRFQERAGIDGVDSLFNDMCGPNTLAHAPWFMMPVRMFSAAANQALANPLFVRIEGVACALAWTALFWLLTARAQSDRAALNRLRTLLFGLLALGMLPMMMAMSRPEQPVILTLTLAMLLTFASPAKLAETRVAAIKAVAIVVLAAIAMSYHLKGVVYAPVFFACMAICARGRSTIRPRITGGAALLALTAMSALYWVDRLRCPADPVLAERFSEHNAAAVLANGGSVFSLALQMVKGVLPLNYVWLALPVPSPMWFPHNLFAPEMTIVFVLVMSALWGIAIGWSLIELGRHIWRERLRALCEPRTAMALALLASLAVWGASQFHHRNFYEATHYLPLAAILCALCLSLPSPRPQLRDRIVERTGTLGLPLSLLSAAIVLASTTGPLWTASRHAGWIPGMPVSVSAFGYDRVRSDVAVAMDRAGMGGGRRLNRLLVDDVTYLALQHHTMPLHWLGVLFDWRGSITDPVAYLVSRNSDGVVMGCQALPARMRAAAARSGEVCAISREGLERIAAAGPLLFDPKSQQH